MVLDPLLEHRGGVGPPGTVAVKEDWVAVAADAHVVVVAVVKQGYFMRAVAPAGAATAVAAVVTAGKEAEPLLRWVWGAVGLKMDSVGESRVNIASIWIHHAIHPDTKSRDPPFRIVPSSTVRSGPGAATRGAAGASRR